MYKYDYIDRMPDYSIEACKIIYREPKFKMIHAVTSTGIKKMNNNLTGIKKIIEDTQLKNIKKK